jgi:predicted Rossmann-fold nucleotide-binding protein
VLNVNGYFTPLLQFLDHAVTEQFVRPEYRALLVVDAEPAALIARMEAMEPPPLPRWVQRETT